MSKFPSRGYARVENVNEVKTMQFFFYEIHWRYRLKKTLVVSTTKLLLNVRGEFKCYIHNHSKAAWNYSAFLSSVQILGHRV